MLSRGSDRPWWLLQQLTFEIKAGAFLPVSFNLVGWLLASIHCVRAEFAVVVERFVVSNNRHIASCADTEHGAGLGKGNRPRATRGEHRNQWTVSQAMNKPRSSKGSLSFEAYTRNVGAMPVTHRIRLETAKLAH